MGVLIRTSMWVMVVLPVMLVQAESTFRPVQSQQLRTQNPVIKLPVQTKQTGRLNQSPNLLPQCSTPDPALTGIRITRVGPDREGRPGLYSIDIRGAVVNAGRGVYSFSRHTVWLGMREDPGKYLYSQEKTFSSGQLTAGQRRPFLFQLTGISRDTEFIPDYTISIRMGSSDPAVDCQPKNNRRILSRAAVSNAIETYLRGRMQITRVRACVRPGRDVVIDGQKFGNRPNQHTVMFANRQGETLNWTDRQLIVKAPAGLDPGLSMQLAIHATNDPSSSVITRFGVRTCSGWATTATATPADFKFGTMGSFADQSRARGVRPLLVVLAANGPRTSRPRLAHDAAYYDRKIFGPGSPNIVNYYKVNSYFATYTAQRGRGFTWRKAAIIGPVVTRFQPSLSTTRKLPSIKRLAADKGFDFSRYDRNRDGRVTASELGILIIDNGSTGGGQTTKGESCISVSVPRTRSRISVCSEGSFAGHDSSLANIAHELSHQLGTVDIYGTRCLSQGLSLMTCTGYLGVLPNPQPDGTFLLDPWHRSRLGWLKPRIYSVTDAGSVLLQAPSKLYGKSYNGGPIILYDPRRGTQEYFILEYREKQVFQPPGGSPPRPYGYDADAPESGVAVWHVKTDAAGNLLQIPDRVPEAANGKCAAYGDTRRLPGVGLSCGNVLSTVVISPAGHGRLRSGWGGKALWKSADGNFGLKWLNGNNSADGDDAGIRLRVYGEGKGYTRVRWDPQR